MSCLVPWWWRTARNALLSAQQIDGCPGVYREAVRSAVEELDAGCPVRVHLHQVVCLWLDAALDPPVLVAVPDGVPAEVVAWSVLLLEARRDGDDAQVARLLAASAAGPDLVGDLVSLLGVLGASLGRRPVSLRPVWGAA